MTFLIGYFIVLRATNNRKIAWTRRRNTGGEMSCLMWNVVEVVENNKAAPLGGERLYYEFY